MLPLVSSPKQAAPKLAASLFPTTTPSMGLLPLLCSALCGLSAGRVLLGGRNDSTSVSLGAPRHLGDSRLASLSLSPGAGYAQFLPPALDKQLASPQGIPLGSLPPGRGGPVTLRISKPPTI